MSIVDDLLPSRGRGRPPKVKETDQTGMTPLERAISRPLPPEVLLAVEDLKAAAKVAEALEAKLSAAKEAVARTPERVAADASRAADSARTAVGWAHEAVRDANADVREAQALLEEAETAFFKKPGDIERAKANLKEAEESAAMKAKALAAAQERQAAALQAEAAAKLDPVAQAQAALVRAQTRQEVASQIGGGDTPTPKEIAELEAAFERARADDASSRKLRVEALKEEVQRQAQMVRAAHDRLHELLAPHRAEWEAAAEAQLATAATLIAQTEQLGEYLKGYTGTYRPFRHTRFDHAGDHVGNQMLPDDGSVSAAYIALRQSLRQMHPHL